MEKLYLIPGGSIGKKGLPGGKLGCKKDGDPLLIEEKYLLVLEKNIPGLKIKGVILDQTGYDKFMTVEDKPADSTKSAARIAIEKEATEFGIAFTDRTSATELKAEIELKKSESNSELEDLRKDAEILEIEFTDETSIEDLKLLIEDGQK